MSKLDQKIEKTREALNKLVGSKGIMDNHTIRLSQRLDILIVKRMRRALA